MRTTTHAAHAALAAVPAGWYPDPADPARQRRLFDGTRWTEHVTLVATLDVAPYLPAASSPHSAHMTAPVMAHTPAPAAQQPHMLAALHTAPAMSVHGQQAAYGNVQGAARTLNALAASDNPIADLHATAAVLSAARQAVDGPAESPSNNPALRTPPILPRLSELARPPMITSPDTALDRLREFSARFSGAIVLSCVLFVSYAAWESYGSAAYADYEQRKLREELSATLPGDDELPGGELSSTTATAPLPAAVLAAQQANPQLTATVPATSPLSGEPAAALPAAAPQTASVQQVVATTLGGANARKAAGRAVGRIVIPSIGVDQVFVSGTTTDALKLGPGVLKSGVFPGQPGNATLAGHRTTHGGPFRHLDKLRPGDRIIISVPGQPDNVFEVRGTQLVSPKQVSVTHQTAGVRLTLSTCHPVGSDAERLIVQAELIAGPHATKAVPAAGWTFQK